MSCSSTSAAGRRSACSKAAYKTLCNVYLSMLLKSPSLVCSTLSVMLVSNSVVMALTIPLWRRSLLVLPYCNNLLPFAFPIVQWKPGLLLLLLLPFPLRQFLSLLWELPLAWLLCWILGHKHSGWVGCSCLCPRHNKGCRFPSWCARILLLVWWLHHACTVNFRFSWMTVFQSRQQLELWSTLVLSSTLPPWRVVVGSW